MDKLGVTPSDRSDRSDSSNDSSDSEPVESLVAGRQRRATAANRYSTLLQQEEAAAEEDEVNLLFADDEDEVDEEFEEKEDAEDADNLSSSDDDDQGPNAAADDLEGERAIQKQEKLEKAKKRKASLALTTGSKLRKKVKIDPSLPSNAAPVKRPSKKKERVSWIPSDSNNARTSLRKQTVAHRAITHAKLKEDEKRALKMKAQKAKRDRERERDEPQRVLTQADRLVEAERVERKNLKSLNRWEETEKKRAEEQAAKLAVLKDRTLEGAYVTSWSGKATWSGPRLSMIGVKEVTQMDVGGTEPKKRGRKSKAFHEQAAAAREAEAGGSSIDTPREQSATPAPSESAATPAPETKAPAVSVENPAPQITFTAPQGPENFLLSGIQNYATVQVDPNSSTPRAIPNAQTPANLDPIRPLQPPIAAENAPPEPPPVIDFSTRNLVILENFDNLAGNAREDYRFFYNHRKSAKPIKPDRKLCPITSMPAKYRDPSTGIPYANAYAYKKIQDAKRHEFVWSAMLGCFVGKREVVARGVPEGFLGT